MSSAREIVVRRVAGRVRRFPDLEPGALDARALAGFDARDVALAGAIDHAVARHWLTLATVLEHHLSRPWDRIEADLRAVLLVGAAQLLLLDRVPDHAAINESVAIAKRLVRARAGGLVNAVLRRTAELRREIVDAHDPGRRDELPLPDGRAWRLGAEVFAAEPRRRLAQQTSHPEALVARWEETVGPAPARALAVHSLVNPPIVLALPGDVLPHCRWHETPGFAMYEGPRAGLDELLASRPGARVQDPAAAAAVESTAELRPRVVIDACAGRGTKTGQLAGLHPEARIIATDVRPARVAMLRRTFGGHPRVEVIAFDELERWRRRADLLVLDVPCSNTGVLARRVEAKYRFAPETIADLVGLQRQILADTLSLLGDRGHLLYASCSIDPAENEEQAAWLARWHAARIVVSRGRLPSGRPGDPPTGYADGGYYALFELG